MHYESLPDFLTRKPMADELKEGCSHGAKYMQDGRCLACQNLSVKYYNEKYSNGIATTISISPADLASWAKRNESSAEEKVEKTVSFGEFSEGKPWDIVSNYRINSYNKECHHCVNGVVPRVIRAYSEGGTASTSVCVECILENL